MLTSKHKSILQTTFSDLQSIPEQSAQAAIGVILKLFQFTSTSRTLHMSSPEWEVRHHCHC